MAVEAADMFPDEAAAGQAELSDAELDEQLNRYQAVASSAQRAGGLPRGAAIVMLICALLGMASSLELLIAEKARLIDSGAVLACDINSFVSCGKWIGAWQNEVFFGISNAALGLAFFAGVSALALVLVTGGRFGAWLWKALSVAMLLGIVWVLWFQYESFFVERSLCPYCFLIWIVTIALFVLVWARALQAGHWGERAEPLGRALVLGRFLISGLWYALLAALALVALWDKWVALF